MAITSSAGKMKRNVPVVTENSARPLDGVAASGDTETFAH